MNGPLQFRRIEQMLRFFTLLYLFLFYSTSELKSLADDEDRLLQLVMELPELSQIAADREEICNKNEELASKYLYLN